MKNKLLKTILIKTLEIVISLILAIAILTIVMASAMETMW